MMTLSQEAECNVIGGLLLYGDDCAEALDALSLDDFEEEAYRQIFRVVKTLYLQGQAIDCQSILAKIKDQELEKVARLAAVNLPSVAGYSGYVRFVKNNSRQRRIRQKLFDLVDLEPDDMLEKMRKLLDSEEQPEGGSFDDKAVAFMTELYTPPEHIKRVRTGFHRLDEALGGLRRKTISYIGARPSTGKTALALNILRNQLNTDNRVTMFSLEMSATQILERLLSDLCSVHYGRINQHNTRNEEKTDMCTRLNAIADSKRLNILDDTYTIEDIARGIAQTKPQLAIVDFIQCVRTTQRFQNRRNEIDYISQEFKRLARRYDCHIMVLSQITRNGSEAPRMSDLKESGGLEQDGDYIMMLHRPYVLDKDASVSPEESYILLDKNKYGRTGKVELRFQGEFQRFTEVAV